MFQNKKTSFYKTFLFVLVFFVFINTKAYSVTPLIAPPASVLAENMEEAKQAVWIIENARVQGTGFFIDENLFVTNYHVVESFSNGVLLNETYLKHPETDQKIKIKRMLAVSISPDLVLLETESPAPFYLELKDSPPHPEEDLFILGYPEGDFHIMKNQGTIRKIDSDLSFFTGQFDLSGASGGPVLDSKAYVSGVLHSSLRKMAFSVPFSVFKQFLKENKNHPCKTQSPKKCLETAFQELFNKVNQENDPVAQYVLAKMYFYGIGVERNIKEFFYWVEKAAEQDHFRAKYVLASMHFYGRGVRANRKLAVDYFEQLAVKGYVLAQHRTADIYYYGKGVEKNRERAFYWMEKAAEQGYALAQYEVANMYYYGRGVEQNRELALYWMERAAEQGYAPAQDDLSRKFAQLKKNFLSESFS